MYIRSAIAADEPIIKHMIRRAHLNPFGIQWQRFLVVEDMAGNVVGVGQVKQHRDGTRELASLAMEPTRRGEGVGRVLVQALLLRETSSTLYLICVQYLQAYYVFFGFRRIAYAAMPPHFQRMYRIANIIFFILGRTNRLIVMKRSCT